MTRPNRFENSQKNIVYFTKITLQQKLKSDYGDGLYKLKIKSRIVLPAVIMMLCFSISLCNNSFGGIVPAYGQQENINGSSPSPSFQSKVAMINQIPSQKATVGDIKIAYKQLGKSNAR